MWNNSTIFVNVGISVIINDISSVQIMHTHVLILNKSLNIYAKRFFLLITTLWKLKNNYLKIIHMHN